MYQYARGEMKHLINNPKQRFQVGVKMLENEVKFKTKSGIFRHRVLELLEKTMEAGDKLEWYKENEPENLKGAKGGFFREDIDLL
jgi:hypothetical protein